MPTDNGEPDSGEPDGVEPCNSDGRVMKLCQLWELAKELEWIGREGGCDAMSVADLDRLVFRVLLREVSPFEDLVVRLHDGRTPILFRQFLELLVRLADVKFVLTPALSERLRKLLEGVANLDERAEIEGGKGDGKLPPKGAETGHHDDEKGHHAENGHDAAEKGEHAETKLGDEVADSGSNGVSLKLPSGDDIDTRCRPSQLDAAVEALARSYLLEWSCAKLRDVFARLKEDHAGGGALVPRPSAAPSLPAPSVVIDDSVVTLRALVKHLIECGIVHEGFPVAEAHRIALERPPVVEHAPEVPPSGSAKNRPESAASEVEEEESSRPETGKKKGGEKKGGEKKGAEKKGAEKKGAEKKGGEKKGAAKSKKGAAAAKAEEVAVAEDKDAESDPEGGAEDTGEPAGSATSAVSAIEECDLWTLECEFVEAEFNEAIVRVALGRLAASGLDTLEDVADEDVCGKDVGEDGGQMANTEDAADEDVVVEGTDDTEEDVEAERAGNDDSASTTSESDNAHEDTPRSVVSGDSLGHGDGGARTSKAARGLEDFMALLVSNA